MAYLKVMMWMVLVQPTNFIGLQQLVIEIETEHFS